MKHTFICSRLRQQQYLPCEHGFLVLSVKLGCMNYHWSTCINKICVYQPNSVLMLWTHNASYKLYWQNLEDHKVVVQVTVFIEKSAILEHLVRY